MNTAELVAHEIDGERFKSVVTISKARKKEQHNGDDERSSKTLYLLRVKESLRLSPEGNLVRSSPASKATKSISGLLRVT